MKKIRFITFAILFALCAGLGFAKEKYISPNNDGVQDELVIPLNISDKRYVQLYELLKTRLHSLLSLASNLSLSSLLQKKKEFQFLNQLPGTVQ